MAEETGDIKRINWAECCGCTQLFRAFRMAISPYRLGIAFAGLLALVLVGCVLDLMSSKSYGPVVAVTDGVSMTELDVFAANNGDKAATLKWAKDAEASGAKRIGTFSTLLHQSRRITNHLTSSASSLSLSGIIDAIISIGRTKLWLIRMHTGFAIIFMVASLAVWALVGGSICRLTALEIARDERIGPMEAIRFTREKFLSFLLAPVVPAGALLIAMLGLSIIGAIGLAPWGLGPIFIGAMLWVAILVGFFMALIIVGSVGGGWLMYPTIAVEGSDAFDAISRSFGYLMARPWRTIFYLLVSMVYGAICLTFVKILARLTLACADAGLGLSMNMGGMKVTGGGEVNKLDALWQAPTVDFVSTPFMGTFVTEPDGKLQTFAQWLVQGWVYGLAILVGAFVVSFAYSSFTIIYFLLRREVDATGFDDVYLDDAGSPMSPTAIEASGAKPGKSGTSLPIIGQP